MNDPGHPVFTLPRRFINGVPVTNRHFEVLYGTDTPWQFLHSGKRAALFRYRRLFCPEPGKACGVPVGIINASWGGKPVRAFIPREYFDTEPALRGVT